MFYSKSKSLLGFSLANNKGNDVDHDPNNDSPPFCLAVSVTVILRLLPSCTTHGGTTMNSEENPWRWRKRKEERNPN